MMERAGNRMMEMRFVMWLIVRFSAWSLLGNSTVGFMGGKWVEETKCVMSNMRGCG